jgi:Helix-turn-helix domain
MVLATAPSPQEVGKNPESTKRFRFVKIPLVVLDCKEISASALKLWAVIFRYDWYGKGCYPSQAQLAKDLGLGERRVRDLLQQLQKANLIQISHRRTEYKSCLYRFPSFPGEFVMLPLEILNLQDLKPESLKLWLGLKKLARQFSACSPTLAELSDFMQLQPRRIRDLVKELEQAKLITVYRNASANLSNIYRLENGDEQGDFLPQGRQNFTVKAATKPELPLQNSAVKEDSKIKINQESYPKPVPNAEQSDKNAFENLLIAQGVISAKAKILAANLIAKKYTLAQLHQTLNLSKRETVRNPVAYLVFLLENDIQQKNRGSYSPSNSQPLALAKSHSTNPKPINPNQSVWLNKLGLVKPEAKNLDIPLVEPKKSSSIIFDRQKFWQEIKQEVNSRYSSINLTGKLTDISLDSISDDQVQLKVKQPWQTRLFSHGDKTLLANLISRRLGRTVSINFGTL